MSPAQICGAPDFLLCKQVYLWDGEDRSNFWTWSPQQPPAQLTTQMTLNPRRYPLNPLHSLQGMAGSGFSLNILLGGASLSSPRPTDMQEDAHEFTVCHARSWTSSQNWGSNFTGGQPWTRPHPLTSHLGFLTADRIGASPSWLWRGFNETMYVPTTQHIRLVMGPPFLSSSV